MPCCKILRELLGLQVRGCHVKNIAKCNESRNVALFQEGKRCQIFFLIKPNNQGSLFSCVFKYSTKIFFYNFDYFD